ncbi:MAG: hypothetical protein ACREQ4_11075 [Candidatus Binataceae bacterium]
MSIRNRNMEHDSEGAKAGLSLEFESILPVQFFSQRNPNFAHEPIRRLMMAVLADAIRCFQTGVSARVHPRRREFVEAEQWLFDAHADGAFSFENVCCALGIGPDYLRRALCRWRMRKLSGARSPLIRRTPVIMRKRVTPLA